MQWKNILSVVRSFLGLGKRPLKLPILFQDEHYVVVNKWSGLLVHASKVDRYETRFALQILRDQIGMRVYPVHRLDKATSGALIFATSSASASLMSQEFELARVQKKYLAVVRGHISDLCDVDYPLKEIQDRKTDLKAKKDKAPQIARTIFKKLASCEVPVPLGPYSASRYSLVEARPMTGRKHQIRRHLKHLSHPIIGDVNYGSGIHNQMFREKFNSHRLLLACTELKFTHPYSKIDIEVQAPLAEEFEQVLLQIGLKS